MASFILLIMVLFSSPAAAQFSDSEEFYRVDTRGPERIFQNGFVAWGSNTDLVAHASGASCTRQISATDRSSAFIAMTSRRSFAEDYAQQLSQENNRAYIYRIRPNQNIYELAESLEQLTHASTELRRAAAWQEEWIAYRNIPRSDIRHVEIYERGRRIDGRSNPNYVQQDPYVNTVAFTSNTVFYNTENINFLQLGGLIVHLCFIGLQICGDPYHHNYSALNSVNSDGRNAAQCTG